MAKVVYILGLSRSGSTFLQFLLSSVPGVTGLGEIRQVVKNYSSERPSKPDLRECSCGRWPEQCDFWRDVLPTLLDLPRRDAHQAILCAAEDHYPGHVIVDSSKVPEWLDEMYLAEHDQGDIDLKVILLVRDFRGWALSTEKHSLKRHGRARHPLVNSYAWWYTHRRMLHLLQRRNVSYLCVSYEALVFNMTKEMARILNFINVSGNSENLAIAPQAHELYGNPMKYDPSRKNSVVYDHRWFSDIRFSLAGPLLLPVYAFSRRLATLSECD